MDHSTAKKIIKDTFEEKFDRDRFRRFILDLLNDFEETPSTTYKGNTIPRAYKPYVRIMDRLGKYEDQDGNLVDILIVYLKKESSLERARTTQRNLIGWYLNGSRGGVLKDGALVAFVSPDPQDWRFSFVKMDYEIVEKEGGGVKAEQTFTPARRFSFLVGTNEYSHTAQKQLIPILKKDSEKPSFQELEEGFSVEPVTERFYEEYRDRFLELKEELDKLVEKEGAIREDFNEHNVDTSDFAKKLMGQIVFLYFLQKKGWFGVARGGDWGSGPKNFLRELFEKEHATYSNFFNDILEPLFYEALATQRPDDYYSRFNCKIPFLNGGLFDPIQNYDWINTDLLLPDTLFSNSDDTGILDVFDRYNFTIKENEPLEKEVAVDPEMLGKVFENLLEVEDRKSKGTYYTPREIVHYMCQESLIQHLETELGSRIPSEDIKTFVRYGEQAIENDRYVNEKEKETQRYSYEIPRKIRENAELIDEKLASIRVCDPAVGSGAFLVGMMNEIIRKRNVLTNYHPHESQRNTYEFKNEAIHNNLYGVDLDPGAVEIAKLRLWLSLVVEEENINRIHSLPNLDYKIMQGNSLLEEYEGIKLIDERFFTKPESNENVIEQLREQEKKIQREYIQLHQEGSLTPKKEKELQKQLEKIPKKIEQYQKQEEESQYVSDLFGSDQARIKAEELLELQDDFFNASRQSKKQTIKSQIDTLTWDLIELTLIEQDKKEKLDEIKSLREKRVYPFFLWRLNFAEVFQENSGFDVVITNPPYIGESGNKNIFRAVREGNLSDFYKGKMDYFYFFFHLALNLAVEDAVITFITTNYYPTADGAENLRNDLKERSRFLKLVNFNELKIFDSARGQHNMISILKKTNNDDIEVEVAETQRTGFASQQLLENILNGKDEKTIYRKFKSIDLFEGDKNYIRLIGTSKESGNITNIILNRVKDRKSELLGELCNISQGVVSGCDTLTNRHINKLSDTSDVQLGDGIFVFDLTNQRDQQVISTFDEKEKQLLKPFFKNSEIDKFYCNKENHKLLLYLDRNFDSIDNYPNIKSHLNRFREILDDRREVREGKISYYELQWPRKKEIFEGEKICVPYRVKKNSFAYNSIDWFCRSDCYLITSKEDFINLKYLLAILNSSLFFFWLYYKGKRKGETLELFYTPLSEIPIYLPSQKMQKKFINLVEKIESLRDNGEYTENLELQLDLAVFQLYDLTFKEAFHVMKKNNMELSKDKFNAFDLDKMSYQEV